MHRYSALIALGLSLAAGASTAQVAPGSGPVLATITRMTEAVNRGEMPTAFAAFSASPSIVDDGAPYRWQGPDAPKAWLEAMGANAQAHGMTAINMKLSAATRVEIDGNRAYAIVPGLLSYVMKDGHSEHADGLLTFILLKSAGDWKIDTLVWTGPQAKP
jgi:ketosteroid isomerase-like protein